MADLKKKRGRRVSVKGKFSLTQRSGGVASSFTKSPSLKSMRGGSSAGKRRDMASSPGPHSAATPTVHSPISDVDEPVPGAEIAPGASSAQENIQPDFLENGAPAGDETPKSALDADIDRDADSLNSLSNSETSVDNSDGQESATNTAEEKLKSEDNDSDNSSPTTNFKFVAGAKARLNRRKAIIIASATLTIAGGLTAFFIALPGFLIQQAKDMLLGKLGDMSSRQQIRYRRAKIARVTDIFSKEGRIGGKMIGEMESRGYTFRFEDPLDKNRVTGLDTPNGRRLTVESGEVAERISGYMEERHPLRTARWKTKRMNAFISRYGIPKSPPTIRAPDSPEDPKAALNKNMANQTEVDEVETRGVKESAPDDATDEDIARQNDIANNNGNSGIFEANKNSLKETGEVVDPDALKLSELVPDGVDPSLLGAAEQLAREGGSIGGKTIDGLKQLTVSGLTDRICTTKNRLRAGFTSARTFRALAAMKQMFLSVNVADGIKLKKNDTKLFAEFMKKYTATDSNGVPVGGSVGFSYILKGKFSKSKNDATRSRTAVDGKPTGVIGGIWNALQLPGTSAEACGRWQNPVTQVGLTVIEFGVGFITGSGSKLVTTGMKSGALASIKQSIKSATAKVVAKTIAKSLVKTAAVELSFEGVMQLSQMYAEKTMTDNFSSLEVGGMHMDIATSGGGVARKQRDLQAGFVPATVPQYTSAFNEYIAELEQERSKQSFAFRIFSPSNPESLVSRIAWNIPLDLQDASNSLSTQLASAHGQTGGILSSVLGTLIPTTSAQSDDEIANEVFLVENGENEGLELATDPYGNVMTILREDIAAVDENANVDFLQNGGYIDQDLEPIGVFKEHVDNCVNKIDTLSVIEAGDPGNPAEDCLAQLDLTVRFKAHLAYLDMFDAIDSQFDPESISQGALDEQTAQGPQSSGPVDCSAAVGNEKIVCAAEGYSGIRYSNGGDKWNTEWGVLNTNGRLNGGASAANWLQNRVPNGYGDFLDCSGYTNLALYVAHNYQTTAGCSGFYARDTNGDGLSDADSNLKIIPLNEVKPGDFLTISLDCNGETAGHIGIFAGVLPSGEWSTLESSAGRNVNGERRSGYYSKPPAGGTGEHDFKYAVRYIGPGSNE